MFKSKVLKVHIIILIVGLVFLCVYFIPNANAGTIVKWVDAQGVTHYGDRLPAQEAGRNNSEINGHGITVRQKTQDDGKQSQQDEEKLAQQHKDSILLASYTKAEEIDLARDRNLQMDQATLQALTSQKEGVLGRTGRNQKLADGFRQKDKPVPAYLTEELKLSKAEASRLDKQIAERKLSMEDTKKRFANEKARFIELKQTNGSTTK
ncbi:MAG: DUF4124 domain-containing protein [Methylophilaceae bacterium]